MEGKRGCVRQEPLIQSIVIAWWSRRSGGTCHTLPHTCALLRAFASLPYANGDDATIVQCTQSWSGRSNAFGGPGQDDGSILPAFRRCEVGDRKKSFMVPVLHEKAPSPREPPEVSFSERKYLVCTVALNGKWPSAPITQCAKLKDDAPAQ